MFGFLINCHFTRLAGCAGSLVQSVFNSSRRVHSHSGERNIRMGSPLNGDRREEAPYSTAKGSPGVQAHGSMGSKFMLRFVGEYEEQTMRVIAKNEKLSGRIEECEKLLAQRELLGTSVTYASVAGECYEWSD
ncbi:hypothetical protein WN51_10981 [Melipona quadrifasciata]|uniref:Uncharacterized protein n=1 Tax=Melipona quadrifasciata TaxID=166423 RepID=A0A0M8ZQB9_9HYME|nr:hypothetical protein WN51_10981 [Melipona quadrifasciata]